MGLVVHLYLVNDTKVLYWGQFGDKLHKMRPKMAPNDIVGARFKHY